jgi:hypothetical protein
LVGESGKEGRGRDEDGEGDERGDYDKERTSVSGQYNRVCDPALHLAMSWFSFIAPASRIVDFFSARNYIEMIIAVISLASSLSSTKVRAESIDQAGMVQNIGIACPYPVALNSDVKCVIHVTVAQTCEIAIATETAAVLLYSSMS